MIVSHLFDAALVLGEVEFKNIPGPNWNSLCEPSLLPLTTDYLPVLLGCIVARAAAAALLHYDDKF